MSRRYMTNTEWSSFKRRLTIAKKKGAEATLKVCESFFAMEDTCVLPDDWHIFNIAKGDAEFAMRRGDLTSAIW